MGDSSRKTIELTGREVCYLISLAVGSIMTLSLFAMSKGIDGIGYATASASIAALVAGTLGFTLKKMMG